MKKHPPSALKLKKLANQGQFFQLEELQTSLAILFSLFAIYLITKLSPINLSELLNSKLMLLLPAALTEKLPLKLVSNYLIVVSAFPVISGFLMLFKILGSLLVNIGLKGFKITAKNSLLHLNFLNPVQNLANKYRLLTHLLAKLLILNIFLLSLFGFILHNISEEKVIDTSSLLLILAHLLLVLLAVEFYFKSKSWRMQSWMDDQEVRDEQKLEQKSPATFSRQQEELQLIKDLPAKVKSSDFIVVGEV